ncbi:bifunctional tRNA (5-methylaminomethyl-2-thiouridine)(34)-methyltransferase MnmD/FAD-dependent 5-carboxymethylaminomethyl-2-thiouridine(34) oxidoreductase MnmC [Glaciecola sp. XM2]|uniref:bifunctional tRNA (5-methylaminomethyl-2-thiouridine)(34)-methyltransferase MnmD/FAD-dependent 5-carboxymethylaminomethyl-2-thiouridine(34) oxidoreductase MnmC n=1 Tax=Glaciecola sp. XM2 TaxID=1914931 RepID=UPI001BDEEB57|nr:bifunctional tRNA (5-methylaminomethyl-2-thiouridine)(34)-methyltransferase MnmD/FAD-dependent 5-carboxymethylaminomethyl-2-thiouridine(34) oxidoreductase MnmC [Glaciecola sp. XM2]MBT1450972.1 bifunctional tRNA (5-methylaminomethyl-2-thiouridine)(34)-methyltransferase MnmD/FAD-dependent 5-carboxymethylaminomethyl-2-thiouridine(34) oxidoreductase MnmC [Glaciecola sp. XM2]
MKLKHADLSFNDTGTPQSDAFGDVYFSNDDGLLESEYVFLQGNKLLERWLAWPEQTFTIAETGLGTCLNVLLTLRAFQQFRDSHADAPLKHLYFVSFEKYPIEQAQLTKTLSAWPELASYVEVLTKQYPPPLKGVHRRRFFNDLVTLDFVFDDAEQGMQQMYCPESGLVDAWYLDGFAPSKNARMWDEGVFKQIARLSKADASLATFTAAGHVKRSLQDNGFSVSKIKGFGRKREMIIAQCKPDETDTKHKKHRTFSKIQPPYFYRHSMKNTANKASIAIVGAGIAGALLAMRLCELGQSVTLICKDSKAAQGASGNPIGGFYPQLNAEAGTNSQFFVHSFLYAKAFYQQLLGDGILFEHDWCGVLQLGFNQNTATRLEKMSVLELWPESLAEVVDATKASDIAGIPIPYPALFLSEGGWISPVSLIQSCLDKANATGLLHCLYNNECTAYESIGDSVKVSLIDKHHTQSQHHYDALVLATGHHTAALAGQFLPVRLTRGQVEHLPSTPTTQHLKTVLCHKGYFTPYHNGGHALGSTYVKNDVATEYRSEEQQQNLNMHQKALADAPWINELSGLDTQSFSGRAAVRCSTPDHLPLVGAMPNIEAQLTHLEDLYKALPAHHYARADDIDNVFVLSGLGSRGITSAPLMVDTLVSQMLNRPMPMSNLLLNAVQPNRFLVRALIRRESYFER